MTRDFLTQQINQLERLQRELGRSDLDAAQLAHLAACAGCLAYEARKMLRLQDATHAAFDVTPGDVAPKA